MGGIPALTLLLEGLMLQYGQLLHPLVSLLQGAGDIAIDFGPIRLEGAIEEWRAVLEREIAEAVPSEEQAPADGWPEPVAEPVPFAIRESD